MYGFCIYLLNIKLYSLLKCDSFNHIGKWGLTITPQKNQSWQVLLHSKMESWTICAGVRKEVKKTGLAPLNLHWFLEHIKLELKKSENTGNQVLLWRILGCCEFPWEREYIILISNLVRRTPQRLVRGLGTNWTDTHVKWQMIKRETSWTGRCHAFNHIRVKVSWDQI